MFPQQDPETEIRVAHLSPTKQLAYNSARLAAQRLPTVDAGGGFETLLATLVRLPNDERVASDALEALRVFWSRVG